MGNYSMINGHPVAFSVIEEHRVVIAELEGCAMDALDFYTERSSFVQCAISEKALVKVALPLALRSVARCHPDDHFDAEVGKRIAYRKLRKKYWMKYSDRLSKLIYHMRKACEESVIEARRAMQISEGIDPTNGLVREVTA